MAGDSQFLGGQWLYPLIYTKYADPRQQVGVSVGSFRGDNSKSPEIRVMSGSILTFGVNHVSFRKDQFFRWFPHWSRLQSFD